MGRAGRGAKAVWVALLLAGCGTLQPEAGPLPVRDQHPAQLMAPHLDPVPARALPLGQAQVRGDVAHTSLWLAGSSNGNSFTMDGEFTRAALDVRLGLGAGVELETELPYGYASGGFLDSFVIGWHDAFGMPDQGRSDAPRNDFEIVASFRNVDAFAVEPHQLQVMDLPVGIRVCVLETEHTALAARAVIELPTGNEMAGFGNGGVDVAFGLVGDVHLGDVDFFAHGHYAFVSDSDPAQRAGLDLRDVTAGGIGGTWRASDGVSLHLQTQVENSVLRDLGFDRAADVQWLLWGGARFACSDSTFVELALGEDLGPYVSPDFTLWLAFGTRMSWQ